MNSIATCFVSVCLFFCAMAPGSDAAGDLRPPSPAILREYVGPPLDTDVVFSIIDPDTTIPRILGVTRQAPAGHSAAGAVSLGLADIVVGSGFVERFVPPTPVGLLIVGGEVISPINPKGLETIIVIQNDRLELQSVDEFSDKGVSGALQTGPWLVRNGEVVPGKHTKKGVRIATRAFVCETIDGEILIGLTEGPVSLNDLAGYLASTKRACINATNLAGGGSEALVRMGAAEIETFGNALFRQASLIGFQARASQSANLRTETGFLGAAASSEGTLAFDSSELNGGVFTHFILQGMAGDADLDGDGTVKADELGKFAEIEIRDFTRSEFGAPQIPVFITRAESASEFAISGVGANYEKVMGVIVGVSNYFNPEIYGTYGAKDALRMYETLASSKSGNTYQLHLLLNSEATRSAILDRLHLVRSFANEQSLTVFYFSGHSFLDDRGVTYLMPFDAELDSVERMIDVRRLRLQLEELPGSRVYLLDANQVGGGLID